MTMLTIRHEDVRAIGNPDAMPVSRREIRQWRVVTPVSRPLRPYPDESV
ncbi:hypothetical protein [Syntrophus aciditrophicus]|nr:hypothetical protein [Syntrophus aciditrophicus]